MKNKDESIIDARVFKSKNNLKKAFLNLLKNKSFEKINVTEICHNASVNRMTFYNHYQDKYDLFYDIISEFKKIVNNKFIQSIEDLTVNCDLASCLKELMNVFIKEFIDNFDIVCAITINQENSILQYIIQNALNSSTTDLLTILNEKRPLKYPIPLLTAYINGGITSLAMYKITNQSEYNSVIYIMIENIIDDFVNGSLLFKK